ncbi:MAG: cob(I)yrinic acid a,c-diamide adenosyltransferase [Rikenellaceae bacterium]
MSVYTKTGDKGTTALVSGERVSKYDPRVEAYGTVDELSAFLALLADKMRDREALRNYTASIDYINCILMSVESHLAAGDDNVYPLPRISDKAIEGLEAEIDNMQAELPVIRQFTIPGGCKLNSLSHVCRTICRRAERRAIVVAEAHPLHPNVVIYLNRLSDYLYLLGRTLTRHCGAEEILWTPEE